MLHDSTPRFVGPSVGPSIGPSVRHTTFSAFMGFLAIPLLPKYSTDLKYGPCPPARDWGSRVSGLVLMKRVSIDHQLSHECINLSPSVFASPFFFFHPQLYLGLFLTINLWLIPSIHQFLYLLVCLAVF